MGRMITGVRNEIRSRKQDKEGDTDEEKEERP
jgi:hypothetical protein